MRWVSQVSTVLILWMFDTTIANVNSIDGCLMGYSHTCDSPSLLTFTQLTMETRLPEKYTSDTKCAMCLSSSLPTPIPNPHLHPPITNKLFLSKLDTTLKHTRVISGVCELELHASVSET